MNDKEIEDLEEKVAHAFLCQNTACIQYGAFDQCYNHSHVLCSHFESYYNSLDGKKQ